VKQAGFNIVSYAGAESFLSGLNIQLNNLLSNINDEEEYR